MRWPRFSAEDLNVAERLIAERPSGESQRSFKLWLDAKRSGRGVRLDDLGHS